MLQHYKLISSLGTLWFSMYNTLCVKTWHFIVKDQTPRKNVKTYFNKKGILLKFFEKSTNFPGKYILQLFLRRRKNNIKNDRIEQYLNIWPSIFRMLKIKMSLSSLPGTGSKRKLAPRMLTTYKFDSSFSHTTLKHSYYSYSLNYNNNESHSLWIVK